MVVVDIIESIYLGACWLSILITYTRDIQFLEIKGLSVVHGFGSFRQWSVGLCFWGCEEVAFIQECVVGAKVAVGKRKGEIRKDQR